jgi:hypothetical protein
MAEMRLPHFACAHVWCNPGAALRGYLLEAPDLMDAFEAGAEAQDARLDKVDT